VSNISKLDSQNWDTVIQSKSNYFKINFKELWQYRDLLNLLVLRDFKSFYKQTIFGPLWVFLQPIFTMLTYIFVFGRLAGLSTDQIPSPLFYLLGIAAWTYFSDCLSKTATVFKDNSAIFGKVYFPRLIIPISIVLSNLVRFVVQIVLLLLVMVFYLYEKKITSPSLYIVFFPILVSLMAIQGLGLGMIISSLTTKYRDLALLLTFGLQLFMYSTTVVYPLSSLSGLMREIVSLNPMTYVLEGLRKGLFGYGNFNMLAFTYVVVSSFILLLIGTIIFNNVEKSFVDTI
jgi:lipopolysaccharide transport system permease protein